MVIIVSTTFRKHELFPVPGPSGCHLRPRSAPRRPAAHAAFTQRCGLAVDGGRAAAAGGAGDTCHSEKPWDFPWGRDGKKMGKSWTSRDFPRCMEKIWEDEG